MPNYRTTATRAARRYGIDPKTFIRQIAAESGFDPNARSPAGAVGIAQIMPGTAKGWGVDPTDPKASLNAAAKNMAGYVKKYGSYENALRAYNAGPGNIERSKGFGETNAYVKKILGGAEPRSAAAEAKATTERAQAGASSVLAAMWARNHPNSVIARMGILERQPEDNTSPQGGVRKEAERGEPGEIYELFYDPAGGWKKGQSIGAIGGHQHVHLAADKARVRYLGQIAQKRFGLSVGENSMFTGQKETSGHKPKSYHYEDEAIDVSGDPKQEAAYVDWVRRKYGLK